MPKNSAFQFKDCARLNGNPPATGVRGLNLRKLASDQEKALHDYFVQLEKTGMPARLQRQANKVLKTGGIYYAEDARRMVRDWLELEEKREKEKEEAWEKGYKVALQKCYKQSKKWRSMAVD